MLCVCLAFLFLPNYCTVSVDEYDVVSSYDITPYKAGDLCFIVDVTWLDNWVWYTTGKAKYRHPGEVPLILHFRLFLILRHM